MADFLIKPKINLHYWLWQLRQIAKKLGFFGLLGLAIILGCALFYISKIQPINKQILEYKESIKEVKQNFIEEKNSSITINDEPQKITSDEIATFYARFPNGASLPKWLNLINETALKQGLLLNRGDYKLSQIKSNPNQLTKNDLSVSKLTQLSSYEIVLPVSGQYNQIRQFIAQVLYLTPALALTEMQIKRENTLKPLVEARLVFVLMLQGNHWK